MFNTFRVQDIDMSQLLITEVIGNFSGWFALCDRRGYRFWQPHFFGDLAEVFSACTHIAHIRFISKRYRIFFPLLYGQTRQTEKP